MADLKISQATADVTLTGTEELPMNNGGVSSKTTVEAIRAYTGEGLGNQSTADQSPAAAATTYIIGSDVLVPSGRTVAVGTIFRWHGCVTKTAAGTAAKSMLVKVGTAGTTADATILTFSLPAGTAVADTGYFEINVTVRVVSATVGVIIGTCLFTHNLATTGLITSNQVVLNVLSGSFNNTTNLLRYGLAFTAGTSEAWTFKQVFAAAKNL